MKQHQVIDNYVVFKELFADTIGTNFRAAEVANRRAKVHKVICQVNPLISSAPDRWKRVKVLLEGIKKSNIAFLYSPEKIITHEDQTLLVFDYFKGECFERILEDAEKKDTPIGFDLAFSIVAAVADIIEASSSIVISGEKSFHGFLTPDNILVNYDGKIFLKNYGIFPYIDKSGPFFSDFEVRYGSWLSPEFLRKEKIVSQTDIFHLGYLVYRMLTGKYFSHASADDFDGKFKNLTFKQYVPTTDNDFLNNVVTFFKKTLHPDPLKRFLTIKEFKDFIANYFRIEELSSVTFNLAYFMNSLYGDGVEKLDKTLQEELEYVVPEPKREAAGRGEAGKGDLVGEILETLDKRKKSRGGLWALIAGVVVAIGVGGFFLLNQMQKSKKLEEERNQAQQEIARRLADNEKRYQEQLKELSASFEKKIATTAEERKTQDDERKRLMDELRKQKGLEEERIKAIEADKKKQEEIDNLKKAEEAKKLQQELDAKKVEEENKKKLEEQQQKEAQKLKEGDQVPLSDLSVKPEKKSGSPPEFPKFVYDKYRGRTMTVMALAMIDETGKVAKVNILGTPPPPEDIKNLVSITLSRWKYSPGLKDGIKVKVWMPVSFKFDFK